MAGGHITVGKFDTSKMSYPGMRTIKTAIAVIVVMVLYRLILGPEYWANGAIMACIVAVICLQDTVNKTLTQGVARVVGTLIGGGIAALILLTSVRYYNFVVFVLVSGICLILVIHICTLLNQYDSVSISCVVFLNIILNTSGAEPSHLVISNVINTLVGITAAYSVNKFVYAPNRDELYKQHMLYVLSKRETKAACEGEPDEQKES